MSRRGTVWSLETERRRIKEGRGSGEGSDYKPWITTFHPKARYAEQEDRRQEESTT